ncbi:sensor histidine kinase [Arsukibacterium sp.]|uniref:sensor histidine kinase n=1 Tax=Arsukibacterium sp. TaxID=1977258 RepID=UPI002FD8C7D7
MHSLNLSARPPAPSQSLSASLASLFDHGYSNNQGLVAAQDQRLQHILNVLPSGVVLLDQRGRISEANLQACAMLGQPLLGELWLDIINRCFRPRSDDGLEVSLADGRRVKLEISALAPQPGQLIVMTDLTETRQLQTRLAHLQRLSTLGKMMASLAHQIRTPLSSAMLYAENLANPKLKPGQSSQFQQKLVARLQDLAQQVNDMLLFARSGTAQAVTQFSLLQLFDALQQRCEVLLHQHQAQLKLANDLPEVMLLGNLNSLADALLNLVHNSVQAKPQGAEIILSVKQQGNQLTVVFSDNGPGIAPEYQQQIFEPFFSRKAQGSGLGLAVVQAVINTHQGSISFQPTTTGACFVIQLPCQLAGASDSNEAKSDLSNQESVYVSN